MCSGRVGEEVPDGAPVEPAEQANIRSHRRLGRTGFMVSDISIGGDQEDADVIRYAYDRGVNYIDTAEGYGNGQAEMLVGQALAHMERKKVFITTKLIIRDDDTEETLLDRFGKCQERLKTDYIDALFIHAVLRKDRVRHSGFHAVAERLRSDGRLRFVGLSCHGPRSEEHDSMEDVLMAAVEDGRYDLMLMTYSFMNKEVAERVIAACREKDLGTTVMKTCPGVLTIEEWDPENPHEDYVEYIEAMAERGMSREEAIERIVAWIEREKEATKEIRPFAEKHGATTNEELREVCLQWVLANPDMHTACMSLNTFEHVDRFVPLSGTRLSAAGSEFLHDFETAYGRQYCRHGCSACMEHCINRLPVSAIMRYAYYFRHQHREKYAMKKYASLDGRDASLCRFCESTSCDRACPYGVNIRTSLFKAHAMLTLA